MKHLAVILLFMFSILSQALGQSSRNILEEKIQTAQVRAFESQGNVQAAASTVYDIPLDQIAEYMMRFPEGKDVLLSTDSLELAEKVSSQSRMGSTTILPVGRLADRLGFKRISDGIAQFSSHIKSSAQSDRMGVIIMAINTVYDSYIWIHATQYSVEARSAQVIFTTLMALTFSLDKDLWARTSGRIRNKVLNIFQIDQSAITARNALVATFGANLMLSLAVQSGRISLLAIDHAVTTSFLLSSATAAAMVSFAMTFAHFSWSELLAEIDIKKHPYAKTMMRRFSEARSLVMGNLAPSGKILNPDVYGYSPIISLGVTGLAGLVALMNAPKIINWVENSSRMTWFRNATDSTSKKFESFLYNLGLVKIRQCAVIYN